MKTNAIRILLAIVIAFALWMYVITVVSPNSEDTFYNIPVNLRGESILNDRSSTANPRNAMARRNPQKKRVPKIIEIKTAQAVA